MRGCASQELGRALLMAFDLRTQADYHVMLHFRLEDVSQLLEQGAAIRGRSEIAASGNITVRSRVLTIVNTWTFLFSPLHPK